MRDPKTLEVKSTVPGADNLNWSQKWAKAVRPQVPRDNSQMGQPSWTPGTMPKGGYRSIFRFDGDTDTKISNTGKPGRKVY
ncbi:hypothetical protein UFOVP938_28 [uncultured Caudovirales phage]|jgi:hypothetical protein|uniref:Uncharacterized protein n=1 Tax=uncultured Caudovirales phage TaxID=2100421 RepID=A0A6J5S3K1_9CAUD|nr:hypothetical protein UFOVP596_16 [uncultured Caudovirales phage]CAB4172602.1 hypothetical protein UFOVP938_28 [uncultured Caudovirales phage]CAB4183526.1 hypothetical protein UFOVP1104_12 [uncultured Caudovirales phage]CAB4202592.1 hypothetical protein UFOVP1371_25 [uncultured Caudovirales phage]CAB4214783.1 hypothetical protein UFOVP1468_33 [uncultured Caudovirales phage]